THLTLNSLRHVSYIHTFVSHFSRDLLHLHSFPTRRSSDLAEADLRQDEIPSGRGSRRVGLAGHGLYGAGRQTREGERRHPRHTEDRKSTRLNSSHVKISYAVFCLKKKKKNKKTTTMHTNTR